MDKWEIDHPIMKDMYKKDSEEIERIICRISTDNQDFIIKGIPNKEESIIQSNVQAHLFLGNEHSMAPKLFPTKKGTYYIQEQGYYFYLMEYIDGRSMEEKYDLIFQGAIQMHISYMQTYGPYAIDSLWKILLFGIDQKEILWERMKK